MTNREDLKRFRANWRPCAHRMVVSESVILQVEMSVSGGDAWHWMVLHRGTCLNDGFGETPYAAAAAAEAEWDRISGRKKP